MSASIASTDATTSSVLTIDLGDAVTFDDYVTAPVLSVADRVRGSEPDVETRITVVLISDITNASSDERGLHEAAFEALRGTVGALTRERAASGLRLNLVRAATFNDTDFTIDYLNSPNAGFTAGATLDLTGEFA